MRKNYISIDTERLESLAGGLGKISNNVINNSENGKADFSNVIKSGLMKNSTNKILNQMKTMSDIFETGKSMILKSVEKMVDTELFLNSNAEKIIVPKLSLVNSSSFNENVNSVFLTKSDGKSINNNVSTNSQSIDFNSVVKYNKKLNNIVKNYENVNGTLEFNYNKKDILNNINNSDSLDREEIDSNTVIKHTDFLNINNNVKEYEDEISINELEV